MKLYYGSEIAEFSFPRCKYNLIYEFIQKSVLWFSRCLILISPMNLIFLKFICMKKKWTTASWALVCNTHLFSCLATPWGFGPPFWSVLSSCLTSRKPGTWSHVLMWLSRSSLIASIPPRSARSGKCFYS